MKIQNVLQNAETASRVGFGMGAFVRGAQPIIATVTAL